MSEREQDPEVTDDVIDLITIMGLAMHHGCEGQCGGQFSTEPCKSCPFAERSRRGGM